MARTSKPQRSNSVNDEGKVARKPIKIKLSPGNVRKIKSKVTEIGPGGKEYVIKDWS